MTRLVRRARRGVRDWSLRIVRRVTPVLRVTPPLQVGLVFVQIGKTLWARLRYCQRGTIPPLPRKFKPLYAVFDAKAACRVLSDRTTFDVSPYDQKMHDVLGRFFLGLDYDTPEYRRQFALWDDIAGGAEAKDVIDAAWDAANNTPLHGSATRIVDVVDWTARTLDCFVNDYFFGIAPSAHSGTRGSEWLTLFQRTSSYVFNIDLLAAHLRDDAKMAGKEVNDRLGDIIRSKLGSAASDKAVVDRLLKKTRDPEVLVTVLAGTLSGLYVPTSSTFLTAVDYLLDLPSRELDRLCSAAYERWSGRSGRSKEHHEDLVARYVLEAARFNPFPLGLQRRSGFSGSLASGRGRTKSIPDGATVVAMMNAVALDPQLADRPGTFAIGRPQGHYLLFGCGQHHCIGATEQWPIAPALMTAMATRLFALRGLRRARWPKGALRVPLSWPVSFELAYDGEDPAARSAR